MPLLSLPLFNLNLFITSLYFLCFLLLVGMAGVGYAVFAAHLLEIRVIIRAAFVYAGLITLVLELYSLALAFLARLLPLGDVTERHFAATAIPGDVGLG